MACGSFVTWDNVPAGSTLKARTRGTNDNYTARIRVVNKHDPSLFWERDDLDPGPATLTLQKGDQPSLLPRIVITGQNPATVTMDIWIEKDGNRIKECTWTITAADSPFTPLIVIFLEEN